MSAKHYYPFDLGLPALGHAEKFSSVMREIRNVCNRASAFHVHLLKCQFEQSGIDHSDSEREDNGSMISEISPTPALEPLLFGTEKEAQSFYDCAKSAMLENYENSSGDPLVTFTLDSASDIHVIQLKEAIKYFSEKSDSNLKVLGVSGNVTRADLQGHLVIVVEDDNGNKHNTDLGIAQILMGELMLLLVFFVGEPLLQLLPICMVVTLTLGELTKQMMVLFLVLLQLVKFVVWFKIMSFYAPYV